MQAVLGSASPSLTALVSQGLRQGNVLPRTLFGPEGNFSNGPEIVQAVAELLRINQGPLRAHAPAPLGTRSPSSSMGLLSAIVALPYALACTPALCKIQAMESCVYHRSAGQSRSTVPAMLCIASQSTCA